MYTAIVIWNICCEDMKCEIDKMFVQLDMMVLSTFMIFYVRPSACLFQKHRGYLCNVCPTNCILFRDRESISQRIDRLSISYGRAYSVLDCVDF